MGNPEHLGDDSTVDAERLLALDIAIQVLPERYQAIVRYRWYEQRGYDEIAEILGITAGTARNLVSQALALLRQALPD